MGLCLVTVVAVVIEMAVVAAVVWLLVALTLKTITVHRVVARVAVVR